MSVVDDNGLYIYMMMTTAYTYIHTYDDNSHNPTPFFLEASRGRGKEGGGWRRGPRLGSKVYDT